MSLLSRLAVSAARAYGALSSNPNAVSASYLVVAGGGSGGYNPGGGGGAGGLLTSTTTLSILNTYSITVGAGGAANGLTGSSQGVGNAGSNSVISGTGLTTITALGGGFGGAGVGTGNGGDGGSGGGAGGAGTVNAAGLGTSGQGNDGGTPAVLSAYWAGGGGGGAGAVGGNAITTGGVGGNGTASSISGSSVTYAGGGGGSGDTRGVAGGAGGTGGGGLGGGNGTTSVAGTANRGGGGGGGSYNGAISAAGGSGIVIISYTSATPRFVGGTLTTSGGNQIHTFTSSGTLSPITPITASYLVVAGGGGAGSRGGGGGGAGGLLTSSTTLYSGATYIVTVGAGGTGGVGSAGNNGTSGSNSVVSGTGLTTITSTGGGYGTGENLSNAGSGGSGGGVGVGGSTPGSGTSGQGFGGGTSNPSYGGGGGGGAGAAGSNAVVTTYGPGGIGATSSISGTSTYYAGGGGGGQFGAAGGNGGGGAGGNGGAVGVSGTTNLGGGGGGGGAAAGTGYAGGAGGSGVVIISYAGSQVFNGGLVTSSGGNTIHTFTSTGALTPLTNNLTNSLRFRASASARLTRTFATTGTNNKIQTFSAWVKRGLLSSSTDYRLMGGYDGTSSNSTEINFDNDSLRIEFGGAANNPVITTQVFRDPSAWYHIVIAIDTTQATAANRIKMYVNGNQITAFSTATYPSQNALSQLTSANANNSIGSGWSGFEYFDGYMADINFIDGQALEPYYFGNNDANGVWKPILYKGTYGTNGFYLPFSDTSALTTSSNVGLGKDFSGNGNYWATNNISITAGTTYDAMLDVPTNTSATVANYCVLNPINLSTSSSTSNANLRFTNTAGGSSWRSVGSTIAPTSGKWYWEGVFSGSSGSGGGGIYGMVGVFNPNNYFITNYAAPLFVDIGYGYYGDDGNKKILGVTTSYGATFTNGDIIGLALDLDSGTLTCYKNNVSQGVLVSGLSGPLTPAFANFDNNATVTANFGQRPFSYTPPSGFVALNTFNLPTPTILQGNKYMDATLYTQNGAASNVIVNDGQFKPDLVWIKCRSNSGTFNNLVDSVRGVSSALFSNSTAVQDSYPVFSSFNSNGFTLPLGDSGTNNTAGRTQVAWQWQAGQSSGSSNTAGSITSTVSVSTTAGFSVVTYTGTGSVATVGHGLGVAPKWIVVKGRTNVDNWPVYQASANASPATGHLLLNTTAAFTSTSSTWNNTAPTSTVFTIGTDTRINQNTITYVAYCWAEIAGFSAFGSYTGNGSADGPFVYTGFRPKFVMVKRVDASGTNWTILDTARDTYNYSHYELYPNTSGAEVNASSSYTEDILSNGFKIRQTDATWNASGGTYLVMAFAENPFKNANAR